jgi:outer membrane immunogenic protein
MNNKKLLLTTALSSALAFAGAGSKVYAQSKNFSGPYISIGGNYQASDTNVSTNSTPSVTNGIYTTSALMSSGWVGFNDSADNIITRVAKSFANNEGEIIPTASIGYNAVLDDKFMLGVEARYSDKGTDRSFSNGYTRSVSSNDGNEVSFVVENTSGTESIKINDKESWTISLNPGYVVNNDLMVYGKLGYTQLKQTASVEYSLNSASNHRVSNELDGYTLGLGAKYNLDKNLFLDFGVSATKFDKYSFSKSDAGNATTSSVTTPNTTTHTITTTVDNDYYYNALVSIGYRF